MVKRSIPLKDTGIKYTYNEVQAINNINNFLKGNNYNEETALNDITLVGNCYKLNPGHKLLSDLDNNFLSYLDNKIREVEYFDKILLNPHENTYIQDTLKYYYLPFRNSKNPILDREILSTILKLNDKSYDQIIFFLSYYSYGKELIDQIHSFIAFYGITFESLGRDSRCGWYEKYPDTDKQIKDEFIIANDNYYNEDNTKETIDKYNKAIGNYAELEFFKYLNKNRKDEEQILWISRFVGDGFGYDIIVYNTITKEAILYEVKGSISIHKSRKIELTKTESNMLRFAMSNDTEYHMVKVFFGKDKTKIYDIGKKGDNYTFNIINDRVDYIFEKEDEKTRKLTYELI